MPTPRSASARLTVALVAGLLALGASQAFAQIAYPKFEPTDASIILDPVFRGQTVSATFEINNTGMAPLEILDSRTSCACASLDLPETIAAGESGKLSVSIDTLRLSGPTRVSIFLSTNDPDNPSPVLKVDAESKDVLVSEPGTYRYLVYQNFEGEAVVTQTVLALDNADFKITKIESPYGFITVSEPRPATEEERIAQYTGTQWRFDAVLDNNPPVGPLTGNVTVHTDHPDQSVLPIPVSGFVRPLAALTPEKVDFGPFTAPEQGLFVDVHLKQFAEDLFEITKIDSTVEGISATAEVVEAGRVWNVRILAQPGLEAGPFQGTLTLHTSHPRQQTITLPIKGNHQKDGAQ